MLCESINEKILMLNEKFGVNVKYFMSVGEKWITFTITYNSDILCEFENNFYNTFEKGCRREVPKFYYLIVRMGMCEFTAYVGAIYCCQESKVLIKKKKQAAKGYLFLLKNSIFYEDKCRTEN